MDDHGSVKPQGRVMTLYEVAALLRISRGSAYEAARRGEIPTIRIGRRLLVPTDALERMLAGNTAEARAKQERQL
jgi:excisionase family DNA binding protein